MLCDFKSVFFVASLLQRHIFFVRQNCKVPICQWICGRMQLPNEFQASGLISYYDHFLKKKRKRGLSSKFSNRSMRTLESIRVFLYPGFYLLAEASRVTILVKRRDSCPTFFRKFYYSNSIITNLKTNQTYYGAHFGLDRQLGRYRFP